MTSSARNRQTLAQRYQRLNLWGKLAAWGSLASIASLAAFLIPKGPDHTRQTISVQKPINGPTTVQSPTVSVVGNSNTIAINYFSYTNGAAQPVTSEDLAKLASEIKQLALKIAHVPLPENAETPANGQSIVLLASFGKLDRAGRKYVLDTGTRSIFFDGNNALRFAVRDSAGEEHSIKLEALRDGSLFDRPLFLIFDVASEERRSFLRIRVNGELAVQANQDYDLRPLPGLKENGPVIGSRADGANPAAFKMMFLSLAHTVLTQEQSLSMMKAVLDLQKTIGRGVDTLEK